MSRKIYNELSVYQASKERIKKVFDNFERVYVSFSGGKDSTVMMHMVMSEAIERRVKIGVLIIDLEAQYKDTIDHANEIVEQYREHIDLHWICAEMALRNAVSNYQPKWMCWDESKKDVWVREKPVHAADMSQYDFFHSGMEFEEFIVLFGEWYAGDVSTAAFIGIRADESLHRYRAIVSDKVGLMYKDWKWSTKIRKNVFNVYPLYDWKTEDIWIFHGRNPHLSHNRIYDKMSMAGVKLSQQRLCQPYGDDQKKGLWLYHILEPETWARLIVRVNGVNSGALYINESGNMTGNRYITKPEDHTWQSFCNLLLSTLPKPTADHYKKRFRKFMAGWKKRGYVTIPDEVPHDLEVKQWAPSWRRMCRSILRNDYWCKGLGQTQPKSEAYLKYKEIKAKRKLEEAA